jgi:hypothetical protein
LCWLKTQGAVRNTRWELSKEKNTGWNSDWFSSCVFVRHVHCFDSGKREQAWTVHLFKPVKGPPTSSTPSHPVFFQNRPQSGWLYGSLELRAKKLIGCETPCETPGEFTDFFIVVGKWALVLISFLCPFCSLLQVTFANKVWQNE